jgi:hypothetical protein
VVNDLERLDYMEKLVILQGSQVNFLEHKLILKDSIASAMSIKVDAMQNIMKIQDRGLNDLNTQLGIQKAKAQMLKSQRNIFTGAGLGVVLLILIVK